MNEGQRFTLKKNERVTGEKRIESLFAHGQSFIAYPLRVVFYEYKGNEEPKNSILVSVPKRKLKSAVKRNRIKRLIRESYRLNKHRFNTSLLPIGTTLDIAFIYLKDELTDYAAIEKSVRKAFGEITNRLKPEEERC